MKSFLRASMCLFIVLSLGACTNPVTVGSDFNPAIDFASYKTYRWHAPNEYNESTRSYLANDILDNRIRNAVDDDLAAKGLMLTQSGPVDFLVNYSVSTEEKTKVSTYNNYSGYAPGWSGRAYYGMGGYGYGGVGIAYSTGSTTQVTHYEEGTFVLDIVEPGQGKLVWRGTAQGRLKKNLSQEERREIVKEVVARVLADFPPK